MENTTLCGTETKTFAVKRENNCLDFLHTVKSRGNLDEIVKSLFTGHCEARSDKAISLFQAVTANEIASLRSQ